MILVSACLAGVNCRYDGSSKWIEKINQLVETKQAIVICPEVMGGLPTPREPAEIVGGNGDDVLQGKARVLNRLGEDVTEQFVQGAYQILEIAEQMKASCLILKESSPSCGSNRIYNGAFNQEQIPGYGVTAALLKANGYTIFSENQVEEALQFIGNKS